MAIFVFCNIHVPKSEVGGEGGRVFVGVADECVVLLHKG
jgi:hypothetical protein